jgi:hypothetical protein
MTSKKEKDGKDSLEKPKTDKPKQKRQRSTPSLHSAQDKVQAVLAIWTERVKTVDVLRSLGINYVTLQQWQERAMEGMLQALESRTNLQDGAALSPRLRSLLEKRQVQHGREKITSRLEALQEIAPKPEVLSAG